jgi:hypothetical protein
VTAKERLLTYLRGWSHAAGCLPIPEGSGDDDEFMRGWYAGKKARKQVETDASERYGATLLTIKPMGEKDSAGPTPRWLPIESAPKDGTIILAEVPDHGAPVVVFWDEALAMAHDPVWVVCWDGEHLSSESRRPIRWQHISTPPVAGEGGEG